jgi:hypothetical protein
LNQFLDLPGLQRVERRIARSVVLVGGEEDENLDLLIERQGKGALGAFAPDDFRGLALAQGIDQASGNGLSLRENSSSSHCGSDGLT